MGEHIRQVDFDFTPPTCNTQNMGCNDILYYRSAEQTRFNGQWVHQQQAERNHPGYHRNVKHPDIISYSVRGSDFTARYPTEKLPCGHARVTVRENPLYSAARKETSVLRQLIEQDSPQHSEYDPDHLAACYSIKDSIEVVCVSDRLLDAWVKDELARIKRTYPFARFGDVSKHLCKLWCNMTKTTGYKANQKTRPIRVLRKKALEKQMERGWKMVKSMRKESPDVSDKIRLLEEKIRIVKAKLQQQKEALLASEANVEPTVA